MEGSGGVGAPPNLGVGGSPQASGGVGATSGRASLGGSAGLNAGGAATAGAGGSVVQLSEPPAKCTAQSQQLSGDQCNYVFVCDEGGTHFADCKRQSDGTHVCQCGTFSSSPTEYFIVHGVDGVEACGVTARACKDDKLEDAPQKCSRQHVEMEDFGIPSCSLGAACGPELELGQGVTVRRVKHLGVTCQRDEPAPGVLNHCSCFDEGDFLSTSPALGDTCETLLDLCTAETRPTFSGAEQCVDVRTFVDSKDGCWIERECGPSLEIGGQVVLKNVEGATFNCLPKGKNAAECVCSTVSRGRFLFGVQMDVSDMDACTEMMELCATEPSPETGGAVTCSPLLQSADLVACTAELSCSRPQQHAGIDITAYGSLAVACEMDDDGWRCSCASGEASKTFELGSATDSQAACDAAETRCPSEISINFGYLSEVSAPPRPKP